MLGARLIRLLIRLRPIDGVETALCSLVCSCCFLLDFALLVLEDLGVATIPSSSNEILVEVTSSVDRSGLLLSVVIENRGKRGYKLGLIESSGEVGSLEVHGSSKIACDTVREARSSKLCFGVDRCVRTGGSSGTMTLKIGELLAVLDPGLVVLL